MQFRILASNQRWVAMDKPAGFHVHPPEDQRHRIPRTKNCLYLLRRQLGKYLYPVHRIDGATSGVLLFALDPETASQLQSQFRARTVLKTYFAVVRGWVAELGQIDSPLDEHDSLTLYHRVGQLEIPEPVGRYETARFSLVRVHPLTGRKHQIRRHFEHLRHPLIGDSIYGDGKQNRFFREKIKGSGLFLKAHSIGFTDPDSGRRVEVRSRWGHVWHEAFELFGVCPLE